MSMWETHVGRSEGWRAIAWYVGIVLVLIALTGPWSSGEEPAPEEPTCGYNERQMQLC